jgi:hypothetical protein
VASVTDPYGPILGFLDRTCCVNPVDNTHYAPITTTRPLVQSIRTKRFIRTLVRSTSLEHLHKVLHYNTRTKHLIRTLAQCISPEQLRFI